MLRRVVVIRRCDEGEEPRVKRGSILCCGEQFVYFLIMEGQPDGSRTPKLPAAGSNAKRGKFSSAEVYNTYRQIHCWADVSVNSSTQCHQLHQAPHNDPKLFQEVCGKLRRQFIATLSHQEGSGHIKGLLTSFGRSTRLKSANGGFTNRPMVLRLWPCCEISKGTFDDLSGYKKSQSYAFEAEFPVLGAEPDLQMCSKEADETTGKAVT